MLNIIKFYYKMYSLLQDGKTLSWKYYKPHTRKFSPQVPEGYCYPAILEISYSYNLGRP